MAPRSCGSRPSADYEVAFARAFDLNPIIAADSAVGRAAALRDHPIESSRSRGIEEIASTRNDMVDYSGPVLRFL
jgi:hypothetical protein